MVLQSMVKPWTMRWWFAAVVVMTFQLSIVSTHKDDLTRQVLTGGSMRSPVGGSARDAEDIEKKQTEEEEEKGGEEEEEEASPEAVSIAATLMGLITFQMLLFYMMNHKDEDMRKYTYEVISSTVSIFCAVLLFQSFNALLEMIMGEVPKPVACIAHMVHMMVWFSVMQLVLAHLSGAIGEITGRVVDYQEEGSKNKVRADMGCFAVLCAHMTGFASIFAWGTLQQLHPFNTSPIMSLSIVPLALLGQYYLQRVASKIRTRVALGDDGEWDDAERVWHDNTAEAEDDVMGLCCSWLMAQALRFWISGVLPNVEGEDKLEEHAVTQICILAAIGVSLAVFVGIVIALRETFKTEEKETQFPAGDVNVESAGANEETASGRFINCGICTIGMSMAWCAFFSSKWFTQNLSFMSGQSEMILTITTALFISLWAFFLIWCLDKLADADWTPDTVDEGIKRVIACIGFAIGFGWEKCFDAATEVLAESLPSPHLSKMALAIACAAVVVPAWRLFILPMSIDNGWKYGFILDLHNTDQWKKVAGDPKFQLAYQNFEQKGGPASNNLNGRKTADSLKQENAFLEQQISSLLDSFHHHLDETHGAISSIEDKLGYSAQM